MRRLSILALAAILTAAGCVDEGGSGQITHSDHRLSKSEQASIQSSLQAVLRQQPVALSGLQASYVLSTGSTVVCGYVTPPGIPPALFGGTLTNGVFSIHPAPGKGQDPARIASVRAFCASHYIKI